MDQKKTNDKKIDELEGIIVNYTGNPFRGYESKEFQTEDDARRWIKNRGKRIYWSQVVHKHPKSDFPKPLLIETPGEEYEMFEGKLNTHFETGMECLGLVFEKDGMIGPLNPEFKENLPESGSNFRYFGNFDALVFLNRGQVLELPDGKMVSMIKDPQFSGRDGYRLSFYPRGFSTKELLELFCAGNVKAKLWVKKQE
jgi:hypothetical protein